MQSGCAHLNTLVLLHVRGGKLGQGLRHIAHQRDRKDKPCGQTAGQPAERWEGQPLAAGGDRTAHRALGHSMQTKHELSPLSHHAACNWASRYDTWHGILASMPSKSQQSTSCQSCKAVESPVISPAAGVDTRTACRQTKTINYKAACCTIQIPVSLACWIKFNTVLLHICTTAVLASVLLVMSRLEVNSAAIMIAAWTFMSPTLLAHTLQRAPSRCHCS